MADSLREWPTVASGLDARPVGTLSGILGWSMTFSPFKSASEKIRLKEFQGRSCLTLPQSGQRTSIRRDGMSSILSRLE